MIMAAHMLVIHVEIDALSLESFHMLLSHHEHTMHYNNNLTYMLLTIRMDYSKYLNKLEIWKIAYKMHKVGDFVLSLSDVTLTVFCLFFENLLY